MRLRSDRKLGIPFQSGIVPESSRRSPSNRANEGQEAGDEVLGMPLQEFLFGYKVQEPNEELWHARRSNVTEFVALIGNILELSKRLFPGPVTMEYACDPEDPTNEYIVFDVLAAGTFSDHKDRFFEWHDAVAKLCPGALSEFRLLVHPKA